MPDFFDDDLQIRPQTDNQTILPPLTEIADIPLQPVHECPICTQRNSVVNGNFLVNDLIRAWQQKVGFNPIADVYQNKILEKRKCLNCGLGFYNYHLSDCQSLYQRIEAAMPTYYPTFRPEYAVAYGAIEQIRPQSVLEIGAGRGYFLNLIKNNAYANETNPTAVKLCRQNGIFVYDCKLSDIKESFDFICAFELFEHIWNCKDFFEQCLAHLSARGQLLLATPNPDGILQMVGNGIFNLPPHHQFDFSYQTFQYLADLYGLKIVHYEESELSYRHYEKYVKQLTERNFMTSDIVGYELAKKRYKGASHTVIFSR